MGIVNGRPLAGQLASRHVLPASALGTHQVLSACVLGIPDRAKAGF